MGACYKGNVQRALLLASLLPPPPMPDAVHLQPTRLAPPSAQQPRQRSTGASFMILTRRLRTSLVHRCCQHGLAVGLRPHRRFLCTTQHQILDRTWIQMRQDHSLPVVLTAALLIRWRKAGRVLPAHFGTIRSCPNVKCARDSEADEELREMRFIQFDESFLRDWKWPVHDFQPCVNALLVL